MGRKLESERSSGRRLNREAIASGIEDPGIVVGALHAREEAQSLAGQLARGQRAGVGQGAVGLALDVAFLLPFLEVAQRIELCGILHPLNDLQIGHEEHIVASQHLLDELDQLIAILLLRLEPRGMEVQAEWGTVAVVVAIEIVAQQTRELFARGDVRAGVDHVATGQRFVERGIITTIQLVHDHLPHGMATRWAVVGIAVALVRHAEIQGIWPDGHTAQRGGNGGIVHKELISHHLELLVATHTQVGSAHANDGAIGDVGKAFHNQTRASHLGQPIVVGAACPVVGVILVRQRKDRDLMAATMQVLNGRIVCILVRDEESALDGAAIGILVLAIEDVLVQVDVVHIDGAVERDRDHLRHLLGLNAAGNACAISRAEAIGQSALRGVALWRTIGILIDSCKVETNNS